MPEMPKFRFSDGSDETNWLENLSSTLPGAVAAPAKKSVIMSEIEETALELLQPVQIWVQEQKRLQGEYRTFSAHVCDDISIKRGNPDPRLGDYVARYEYGNRFIRCSLKAEKIVDDTKIYFLLSDGHDNSAVAIVPDKHREDLLTLLGNRAKVQKLLKLG